MESSAIIKLCSLLPFYIFEGGLTNNNEDICWTWCIVGCIILFLGGMMKKLERRMMTYHC